MMWQYCERPRHIHTSYVWITEHNLAVATLMAAWLWATEYRLRNSCNDWTARNLTRDDLGYPVDEQFQLQQLQHSAMT